MTTLRHVERLVLGRLELNARIQFSTLGRQIRKSQQQVSYTVNSLVEKGVIRQFYPLMDYSKLDSLNFRVYFKVVYISQEKFDEMVQYLIAEPHTAWIAGCGGRYDLICTFLALNPSQFNKTLRGIMEKFPEQLQNYTVLTTIVITQFGRKYLFRHDLLPAVIIGGDRKPEKVDETDLHILQVLAEDGRASAVRIGQLFSMSPKTVIERIKRLQERKIILGFRPSLNPRKMNYISALLTIKYHNISIEMEKSLISHLKAHPNVVSIAKTLGEWDIEIITEAPDIMELRKTEMEIRQKFTVLIQQIESVPLYKIYKTNFFPKFLVG